MYNHKKLINGLCLLDYIRQENVLLKDQLSVLLQLEITPGDIQTAEWFHQKFIENDQIVELLRYEINTVYSQRRSELKTRQGLLMNKRFQMIYIDIQNIKKEFLLLKEDFNHFKSGFGQSLHFDIQIL